MTRRQDLTVGVNLLWCLPGAVGGSEEYLVRQLTGLREAAPEIRARLFVLPGFAAAHRELTARQELVVASLDARRRSRRDRHRGDVAARPAWTASTSSTTAAAPCRPGRRDRSC